MQWFKSAMVVSSVVFVGAMAANGCSSNNDKGGDSGGGDVIVKPGDSSTDTKKPTEGGGGCSSGLSCETCDGNYSITAMGKPIGPNSGACSQTVTASFVSDCLATTATTTSCQAWQTANTACAACAVTSSSAANWGPLYQDPNNQLFINIPGCVDEALGQVAQENGTDGSCGDELNASYGCFSYSCGACGVAADGGTDTTDETTCDNAAQNDVCSTYYGKVTSTTDKCAVLNGDAAPAAVNVCFPSDGQQFSDTDLGNLINYMCGTGS